MKDSLCKSNWGSAKHSDGLNLKASSLQSPPSYFLNHITHQATGRYLRDNSGPKVQVTRDKYTVTLLKSVR